MIVRKSIYRLFCVVVLCPSLLKLPHTVYFPIPSIGRCELYGDPHYISFQGVPFDFLDDCTYILVEEQSLRHNLTIAVDNYYCVPGLQGSCAKGLILQYQSNIATLTINPDMFVVQVKCNITFIFQLLRLKLLV